MSGAIFGLTEVLMDAPEQVAIQTRNGLPLFTREARFQPESWDPDNRTMVVSLGTGSDVLRLDWETGERYIERLSMDPAHIRDQRLAQGMPFFEDHASYTVRAQVGRFVKGQTRIEGGEIIGPVRLSKAARHADTVGDMVDGLLTDTSIGYLIHGYDDAGQRERINGIEVRTAIDWEPYEGSVVGVKADLTAGTRSGHEPERNTEDTMSEPTPKPEAPANAAPAGVETRAAPMVDFSARNAEIRSLARQAKCPQELIDNLCDDATATIESARAAIQADWFQRQTAEPPIQNAKAATDFGVDEDDKIRAAMAHALGRRSAPQLFKDEGASGSGDFMGMRLGEMLRFLAKRRGARGLDSLNEAQLVDHIFNGARSGTSIALGMTTGDFSNITSTLANLAIARQYAAENPTYRMIADRRVAPNFQAQTEIDFGTTEVVEEVGETGEIKLGKFVDSSNTWSVLSYAKRFPFTRRLIVDSRVDLLTQVPLKAVKKIATFEQNVMMNLIIDNGNMSDGVAWFHTDHDNLATSTGAPDATKLNDAFKAMALQTDIDGVPMNLVPKYALSGHGLRATFAQLLGSYMPSQASNVLPGYMAGLEHIAEGRIDASDEDAAWYLFADPMVHPALVYAYLEGFEAPRVSVQPGWEIQGVEFKIEHDFGGSKISTDGIWKNVGE